MNGSHEHPTGLRQRLRAVSRRLVFYTILPLLISFSHGSSARDLLIVAPDLPGASEKGGIGRDAEIVRQVLTLCGHHPEFVVHPFGRHLKSYREIQRYDAVMTVPLSAKLEGSGTAAYIWYQNGAFFNPERVNHIDSVRDLTGLNVVTFRDGMELLELKVVAPGIGSVLEIADQQTHSKLLLLGRVHAILADGLIIAEINRRNRDNPDFRSQYGSGEGLRFAPIFLPLPYKMVFRDPILAGEFDRCFDEARSKYLIYRINERYLAPLQSELRYSYLGF